MASALVEFIKGLFLWLPRQVDRRLRSHYTHGPQASRDRENLEALATALAEVLSICREASRQHYQDALDAVLLRAGREELRVVELGARVPDPELQTRLAAFQAVAKPRINNPGGGALDDDLRRVFDAVIERIRELQAALR
jgi:hypothetical protein